MNTYNISESMCSNFKDTKILADFINNKLKEKVSCMLHPMYVSNDIVMVITHKSYYSGNAVYFNNINDILYDVNVDYKNYYNVHFLNNLGFDFKTVNCSPLYTNNQGVISYIGPITYISNVEYKFLMQTTSKLNIAGLSNSAFNLNNYFYLCRHNGYFIYNNVWLPYNNLSYVCNNIDIIDISARLTVEIQLTEQLMSGIIKKN